MNRKHTPSLHPIVSRKLFRHEQIAVQAHEWDGKNPVLILSCPYLPPNQLVKPFKFSCRSHVGDPETTFIL
jgi:hypothetical protein